MTRRSVGNNMIIMAGVLLNIPIMLSASILLMCIVDGYTVWSGNEGYIVLIGLIAICVLIGVHYLYRQRINKDARSAMLESAVFMLPDIIIMILLVISLLPGGNQVVNDLAVNEMLAHVLMLLFIAIVPLVYAIYNYIKMKKWDRSFIDSKENDV